MNTERAELFKQEAGVNASLNIFDIGPLKLYDTQIFQAHLTAPKYPKINAGNVVIDNP